MTNIVIPVLHNPSAIYVGRGTANLISDELEKYSKVVVFADHAVARLHLDKFLSQLQCRSVHSFTLPPGESTKSRHTKILIENYLFSIGCTRDSCFIALGGGVMGDLIGILSSS